ncbi:MAG TPA: histidine kinase dimerization/phospho-acceptor domain-containing protein [Candidatus Binatia bacterium]|nr:histidine kinase dimerization/phospho-acceptor domain-containing protein [Candidatus Binatia bacterium]
MKRILVIDESEVVRETLALILGREFVVLKRSFGKDPLAFAEAGEQVDLLIFGVTPNFAAEPSSLLRFAARAPFAILFLVDSKSTAKIIEDREQVGCLAKPFNPYDLRDKVGRLLARREGISRPVLPLPEEKSRQWVRYLDFPYLSRTAASLVRRFGTADLPLLISGEIGCGQERVALAVGALRSSKLCRLSVDEAQVKIEAPRHPRSGVPPQESATGTLLIENLDKFSPAGQSALLNFLEEETRFEKWRMLTTAQIDPLEKVYQGQFLEPLYYKLATLKLKLLPIRERREDVPALAAWFGQFYAQRLGLGKVSFSPEANERLGNYLWFGNLSEMETVIARTLAVKRKSHVQASDLVFDSYGSGPGLDLPELDDPAEAEPPAKEAPIVDAPRVSKGVSGPAEPGNGHAPSMDLNLLIHELAHELKNPMVTIKTFAQLLADRYQDENFRARFQDVVGGDIERMDELLEIMIEFAEFSQPRSMKVSLAERLRAVLEEISSDCMKRQIAIRWMANVNKREIWSDEDQLTYALRNVLLAVLPQTKMGSEIEMDINPEGALVITYLRDGARLTSVTHYFGLSSAGPEEDSLPLRMLLAKHLVERNGGKMVMDHSHSEREVLRMEFPTA